MHPSTSIWKIAELCPTWQNRFINFQTANIPNLFCSHRLTASFNYHYSVKTAHSWIWGKDTFWASSSTLANGVRVSCLVLPCAIWQMFANGLSPAKQSFQTASTWQDRTEIFWATRTMFKLGGLHKSSLQFFPSNFSTFLTTSFESTARNSLITELQYNWCHRFF